MLFAHYLDTMIKVPDPSGCIDTPGHTSKAKILSQFAPYKYDCRLLCIFISNLPLGFDIDP